jgi:hypothetical protein
MVAAFAMAINPCAMLCGASEHQMQMPHRMPMPIPAPRGRDEVPTTGCHACLMSGRSEEEDEQG